MGSMTLNLTLDPNFNSYPHISESSNTVGLVWVLSDVGMNGKSEMAAVNRMYYISTFKHDGN